MRSKTLIDLSTQTKLGLGAALATIGALGMVLSLLLGWSEAASTWNFVLGFVVGVVTGLGATLVLAGLIEHKRRASVAK